MSNDSTEESDYRLQAITTLTEDWTSPSTGNIHKAGTTVQLVGSVKYDQSHTLMFPIPSMTALFLDQSYQCWIESQHFLEQDRFLKSPSKYLSAGTIFPKEDFLFFDLIQKRMVAIVFAYTALETFANESIPEGHIFRRNRDDKRCTEEFTKEQTELLSLDLKLHEVLPPIFSRPTPKGSEVWQKYIALKKLRDRIIHMKSKDKRSAAPTEDTIWSELLDRSRHNLAIDAKDIIGFYLDALPQKPRWYAKFPW